MSAVTVRLARRFGKRFHARFSMRHCYSLETVVLAEQVIVINYIVAVEGLEDILITPSPMRCTKVVDINIGSQRLSKGKCGRPLRAHTIPAVNNNYKFDASKYGKFMNQQQW